MHIIRDRPYGLSGTALGNVLNSTGTIRIDANFVNVLKPALYLLRCSRCGVLAACQILLKLFKEIQIEAFVLHKLPCLGQSILFACAFGAVDIDTEDDLQCRLEIQAFKTQDALETTIKQ